MNNDLISRSALKKVISEYIDEYSDLDNEGNHCEKWCAMKEAEMAIDNAPTVELQMGRMTNGIILPIERSTGEWIIDTITRNTICSRCRQSRRDTRTKHIYYCNHCGARMINA